ncbi:YggT family protein [Thermithiobacillus tepidarius DSM 3134]|uniref:YggT family protein n=1 Tax=Thermithiobacillus tepidarius TaxID=929 RepID=UPI0003FFBF76|nr:YggT family protein [Thermithiobacillus tepidarius]
MVTNSLLLALATVVDVLFTIFFYLVLVRALLSWVNPDPYNPVVRFIVRATEPVMAPARRIIPPISGFDLSPIVVLLLIQVVKNLLVNLLYNMAGPGLS